MLDHEQTHSVKQYFVPLTKFKAIHFITIVGLIVFLNSLFNNFAWDDLAYIINNPLEHVITWHNIFGPGNFNDTSNEFYRPIPALYFAVIYTLFQQNSFFYHIIQLTLHIVDTVLIFYLFTKFFNNSIALLLSLVFLIHPIQVESVSFIAQTVNPMFLLFGLTALLASSKIILSKKRLLLIYSLLLLSCLTKETGVIFIVLIIVYRALFVKNNQLSLYVFGALTVATYLVIRFFVGHVYFSTHPASGQVMVNLPLSARILDVPAVMFYYLKTLVFPNVLIIYQQWTITHITLENFYFPGFVDFLFLALVMFFGLFLLKSNRKAFYSYVFFALWFIGGLGMILQIFPLDMTVADRWFYFPLAGLLGMLGVVLEQFWQKKTLRKYFVGVLLIAICLFSVRTIVRNSNWHDDVTLYEHDIPILKAQHDELSSYSLEHDLIPFLIEAGQLQEAQNYTIDYMQYNHSGDYEGELAYIYADKKEYSKAEYWFKKAVLNGGSAIAYQNLCRLYLIENKYVQARNTALVGLTKYPHDHILIVDLQYAQAEK